MLQTKQRTLFSLAALALAASLVACDRPDAEPTVGQQVDRGLAQAERQVDSARDNVAQAGQQAGESIREAGEAVADKAKDAAITAQVNAELARDDRLSALRIDVDTVDGRVALNGTAPDAVSRERATELARSVDGVVAVENRLEVAPRS